MNVSEAAEGFLTHAKRSIDLSPSTADNYKFQLTRFIEQYGERDIASITSQDVTEFLFKLESTQFQKTRDRMATLSRSTVVSHYRTLRALFSWAAKEKILTGPRPDNAENHYKAPQPMVAEFTQVEVKKMLKACDETKEVEPEGKKSYKMKRPTAIRDKAIILMLLDTGMRVSEMCRLTMADVNLASGEVNIKPYLSGLKSKARHLYLGETARQALWRYAQASRKKAHQDDPFFRSMRSGPMDRHSVGRLLEEMGHRAGVKNVHPHRFRHTYAIEALRNGIDIFTLQTNLGHSTLEMVRYYLNIAKSDQAAAQERTSPADRWHL